MQQMRLMGACTAGAGGLTQAMQAQKVLANEGIAVQVIKSDASEKRGCAYVIQYPCASEKQVREILRRANIRLRDR